MNIQWELRLGKEDLPSSKILLESNPTHSCPVGSMKEAGISIHHQIEHDPHGLEEELTEFLIDQGR